MTKRISKTPCLGGIYRITCTATGKSYIGSTRRVFKERWSQHLSELRRSCHANERLQNAWNKYGVAFFEFCQLEPVSFVEDLIDCEQKWIDIYQSFDRRYGLNIQPRADRLVCSLETRLKISAAKKGKSLPAETVRRAIIANIGRVRSFEERAKISKAHTGRKQDSEHSAKSRSIRISQRTCNYRAIAPDGTVYEDIPSLRQFCKEMKLSRPLMGLVANGKHRQHKGWKCEKVDRATGVTLTSPASLLSEGERRSRGQRQRSRGQGLYNLRATSPDGTVYEDIPNLRQFCRDFELHQGSMSSVARGGKSNHKGWKLERVFS